MVITEIEKAYPFRKGKNTRGVKAFQSQNMGTQNLLGFQIGTRGQVFLFKTSKTDMFILKCDGTAIIDGSIFFFRHIDSFFHDIPPFRIIIYYKGKRLFFQGENPVDK